MTLAALSELVVAVADPDPVVVGPVVACLFLDCTCRQQGGQSTRGFLRR